VILFPGSQQEGIAILCDNVASLVAKEAEESTQIPGHSNTQLPSLRLSGETDCFFYFSLPRLEPSVHWQPR
jgi:hypothetical protein